MSAFVGSRRRAESKSKNRKDPSEREDGGTWDYDIEGAAAEMAFCKARGLYWSGSVGSFHSADVNANIQVRSTARDDGCLILREGDNPEHYYALVTGRAPKFRIVGWARGREVMKDEFLKAPNGRPPAWFFPQGMLKKFPEKRKK